jgi:hypothetical protein
MSRYTFPGNEPRYTIIVGYASALISFFAQVEDRTDPTTGGLVDEETTIGDSPPRLGRGQYPHHQHPRPSPAHRSLWNHPPYATG